MIVKKLDLLNFKNYEELNISLSPGINCFAGENGSGKTNLLDAIYFLSLTKSASPLSDSQLIKHDTPFFMAKGVFESGDNEFEVLASLKLRQKKIFKCNHYQYEKLSEHVGKFPIVLISPNDTDIIREGSETRRKFIDNLISQFDREYLTNLIKYNHQLKQRNSLLKQVAESGKLDRDLLGSYDVALNKYGTEIFRKRQEVCQSFIEDFQKEYLTLTENKESVGLSYESQLLNSNFIDELAKNIDRDCILQRTTFGIHKDDFIFTIGGHPLKKFGSQGQQKSFVIALQLAKFTALENATGLKPILLLDDIFDKLDESRTLKLLKMVHQKKFSQVLLTDASLSRCKEQLKQFKKDMKLFEVSNGNIKHIKF